MFALGALAASAVTDVPSALHVVYAKVKIVEAVDSDSDGLADVSESAIGTDPSVADTDGDGLTDGDEEILLNTFATRSDTDGDGFMDGLEVAAGADPRSAGSVPITVSGRVVNETMLEGPVKGILYAANPYSFVASNAASAHVCREFSSAGCPAEFVLANAVGSGNAFCIEAWMDVNTNGVWDAWEPAGVFETDAGVSSNLADVVILLECDDFVDMDGNGLADTWEWRHFGKLGNSATEDPDNDGLDNAGECRWWTDPFVDDTDYDGMTDGDEVFVGFDPTVPHKLPTLGLYRTANGMFRIEWDTRYFQGYMPQFTDSLSAPAWSNLVPHAIYEYESYPYGTKSVIDVNTNNTSRFYRIKLVK